MNSCLQAAGGAAMVLYDNVPGMLLLPSVVPAKLAIAKFQWPILHNVRLKPPFSLLNDETGPTQNWLVWSFSLS